MKRKYYVNLYRPVHEDSFQEQATNPTPQQMHHGQMKQDPQGPTISSGQMGKYRTIKLASKRLKSETLKSNTNKEH